MATSETLMPASEEGKVSHSYNLEMGEAKFTKNGESVDVDVVQPTTKLIGLTKEELEKYRNGPFWKPVRYALFALFWVIWLAMFMGAVLIVVLSPKCKEPIWHKNSVNYQIFTGAFRDADNKDGVGDLNGIKEKLNDLRRIGVTAIWPTPVVITDKDDFSPAEVIDILDIDPKYGSKANFEDLITATHSTGLKFIVDIPLTVRSRGDNWAKAIPGSTINAAAAVKDSDKVSLLNLANEAVLRQLVEAARRFLSMGVDGFHLTDYGLSEGQRSNQKDGVQLLTKRIQKIVEEEEQFKRDDLLIFTHSNLGSNSALVTEIDLLSAEGDLLKRIQRNINTGNKRTGNESDVRTIWKVSDLNLPRIDERLQNESSFYEHKNKTAALLNMIQLFLPGSVNIYYGQEINLPSDPTCKLGHQRGHMLWDNGTKGGFTDIEDRDFFGTLKDESDTINFKKQFKDKCSILNTFKRLTSLRSRSPTFKKGELTFLEKDGLHIYTRSILDDNKENVYLLVVNWAIDGSMDPKALSVSKELVKGASLSKVAVKVSSACNDDYALGSDLNLDETKLQIQPWQAIVLEFAR